jgi:hypothetical protein
MTREQIANIEAGPECDKAVAEACQLEAGIVNGECLRGTDNFPEVVPFRPSTDLNDAFFAAERFEFASAMTLLDVYVLKRLPSDPPDWAVADIDMMYQSETWIAHAATTSLAICRAILILKAESP